MVGKFRNQKFKSQLILIITIKIGMKVVEKVGSMEEVPLVVQKVRKMVKMGLKMMRWRTWIIWRKCLIKFEFYINYYYIFEVK